MPKVAHNKMNRLESLKPIIVNEMKNTDHESSQKCKGLNGLFVPVHHQLLTIIKKIH